jgi:hypothetical protein
MPTLEHNGLIEMFRENPSLAPHFLSLLFHVEVPSHASVRVADTALDQLIPVEFRADLVLELRDDKDLVVFAIVLEAQRDQEPRKRYSWPVYVAVARAERECPTVALVIAIDAGVATWAAEKIDLGLGLGGLQPLVLGPATVPVVTEPELAEREVELAILSAMAHGNGPDGLAVVRTALDALSLLDREHAAVYFQIIWDVLRRPMRRALEELVMVRQSDGKIEYPPFVQRIFEQGEQKGFHDGELKGKLDGLREGKLDGLREVLLRLLSRAQIAISEDDRARIDACADPATLDRWIENVLGAKTAGEVLR